MSDVINDLAEENSDICDKNWKKFKKRQSRFNVFNPT